MGSTLSTRVFCLRWFTFGCMSLLFVPVQAFSMDKSGNVCVTRDGLTGDQFRSVMQQIADGWNEGDASKAAECFAEDAIYSAPPAKGHHGRGDLYEFFGGEKRRPFPMHMKWHHLLLNRSEQIGVGEYTFRYKVQTQL